MQPVCCQTPETRARHELTYQTPLLSLANAVTMLLIYGAIWTSSRGQHPYRGPSLGVIGVVYIMVAVIITVSVAMYVRATTGISGRSRREGRITAIPLLASIVGVYVFAGALKYDGFSAAIVYGSSTPQHRGSWSVRSWPAWLLRRRIGGRSLQPLS